MPMFDRYIAVDWSANNSPKRGKDSIWSACGASGAAEIRSENHLTRRSAETWLRAQLIDAVSERERVLVGLDFPFGYPAGFASCLGLSGAPWLAVWDYLEREIVDSDDNRSNRFGVAMQINEQLGPHAPFWGRPRQRSFAGLPAEKTVSYRSSSGASGGLREWRQVEIELRARRLWPQPAWKLMYTGSVGSQALLGIPVLQRLRSHEMLRLVSRVWPFEIEVPDLPPGRPAVVHAEIWPSIVKFSDRSGSCKDEQQVRALVARWQELDRRGQLGDWFVTPDDEGVRSSEGWVLGVPGALRET